MSNTVPPVVVSGTYAKWRVNYALGTDVRITHHSSWLMTAARHIAHAVDLDRRGWRRSHAFYAALRKAQKALECALTWAESPKCRALLESVEDALTSPTATVRIP